ncbi:hypothetical protein ABZT07_25025 [Streptomyces sp. NPDC005317]|uniref:alpha/beta hydrolase n=1 Tax=Streptomyces sp. NPDC005317 TaxID=3156876 RepID=UPI0033A7CB20
MPRRVRHPPTSRGRHLGGSSRRGTARGSGGRRAPTGAARTVHPAGPAPTSRRITAPVLGIRATSAPSRRSAPRDVARAGTRGVAGTGSAPTPARAENGRARLVDPSRVAVAGHSVGGASTLPSLLADSRIRAGIDIDGTTQVPVPDSGLSRPFLFLGRQSQYTPGSGGGAVATWERDWRHLTGWKRWLVVSGAEHASFTDVGPLAEQLGIDIGAGLPAARVSEIVRRYTRAFLQQHLRHLPQPLLDKPSARYPQVLFCAPESGTCV